MRAYFPKQAPKIIIYRDYKHFDVTLFRNELLEELNTVQISQLDNEIFEDICVKVINIHAPLKEKHVRANNSPFMNKTLSKAVMTRTRLRNKFLKNPTDENRVKYTKYRNYCTRLFRKQKKIYYNNLDMKLFTDNKKKFENNKTTFLR